ncbi:probable magnesium transporter NIPA9 isoform X2 [Arachis hypogaea]|uniref:probable magnesium transporter NIPA9 isoform X2 n=1 Tax=Arachis hypogaea TaxID=3818 RepID=UPI0007896D35|nr:probable magnesium transporter NIPA9 isoform X2 [Arachis hypogaea]
MWESIVLTVAATAGNNIGKILQKKGTVILPPLSLKLKVIRAYAFNKIWVIGFLMDIGGALLMLRALSLAPVSVIQPVSGVGLAILSIFSHFYLKEIMNAVDWVGIALAGVGTIGNVLLGSYKKICRLCIKVINSRVHLNSRTLGVGAGGEEQEAATLSIFHIPCLAFVVAILFVLLNGGLRICRRHRREQEMMEYDVVEEIIYGLESGILFGMSSVISKMGFLFLEQGFHQLLVPLCIIFSVCCSGTGFYYQTRGLKHGRAIVVSTCAAVASIVSGVLAGMLALGERLPSAPKARLALLLGWLLIITGVILLVGSTRLVKFLSCSSGRTKRSNADKSYGARRPSSLRIREPNPSTVIPATTLNHLLPSASKEKA